MISKTMHEMSLIGFSHIMVTQREQNKEKISDVTEIINIGLFLATNLLC